MELCQGTSNKLILPPLYRQIHENEMDLDQQKWNTTRTVVPQWPSSSKKNVSKPTMLRDWWKVVDMGFRHLMVKAFGFLIT